MSSGVKLFLVTLLIPFLAGLGHDVYLNYFSSDEKIQQIQRLQIEPEKFMVSDMGWVWNNYAPSSMQVARDMTTPENWSANIDPILQLPTMVLGLLPFCIGALYLPIAFVAGIFPFSRYRAIRGEKADDFAVYKHAKSKFVKFKK